MELIVTDIDSSMIARMAWEDESLTVTFNKGGAYRYDGVPLEKVTEVLEAESIGSTFWRLIRDSFPYQRVTG